MKQIWFALLICGCTSEVSKIDNWLDPSKKVLLTLDGDGYSVEDRVAAERVLMKKSKLQSKN